MISRSFYIMIFSILLLANTMAEEKQRRKLIIGNENSSLSENIESNPSFEKGIYVFTGEFEFTYTGETSDGETPEGGGVAEFDNGDNFFGTFKNGVPFEGKLKSTEGKIIGQWHSGFFSKTKTSPKVENSNQVYDLCEGDCNFGVPASEIDDSEWTQLEFGNYSKD